MMSPPPTPTKPLSMPASIPMMINMVMVVSVMGGCLKFSMILVMSHVFFEDNVLFLQLK